MKGSKNEILSQINTIVLSAGHGDKDSGAVDEDSIEAEETIYITELVAQKLRKRGISVAVVPHELDSGASWVNERYMSLTSCWAVEIHRDSSNVPNNDEASTRCGVFYYRDSKDSYDIAAALRKKFIEYGASPNSWIRPDTAANSGRLEWLADVIAKSHLIELGFIQGKSDQAHLDWLADLAFRAIYEIFTGKVVKTDDPEIKEEPVPDSDELPVEVEEGEKKDEESETIELQTKPMSIIEQAGTIRGALTLILTLVVGTMWLLEIAVPDKVEIIWTIAFGSFFGEIPLNILKKKN